MLPVHLPRTVSLDRPLEGFSHFSVCKVRIAFFSRLDRYGSDQQHVVYNRLGYHWATSLLAFLTLAMLPFP